MTGLELLEQLKEYELYELNCEVVLSDANGRLLGINRLVYDQPDGDDGPFNLVLIED